MRSALLVAGFAALVVASPAPQGIDFDAIDATTVDATGPPPEATPESDVYVPAEALADATAAVSSAAIASGSAANTVPAATKRDMPATTWPSTSTTTTPTTMAGLTTAMPTTTGTSTTTTCSNDGSTLSACATQPGGYGPKVTPDTVAAFLAYPPFHAEAQAAKAPAGYVQTFKDLNASVTANSYLGYYLLTSYDTVGCSQWCDNTTLCTGFNLYIERDPSVNPSDNCTNVPSITNYGCSLWGSGVSAASATNSGQYRGDFQVVITGSDGYEKSNVTTPVTPPAWTNPQNCSGHAHNHPTTCMGTQFFPGPFNPAVCATYATAQNAHNQAILGSRWFSFLAYFYNPYKCNFFNAYMLKRDGVALGTYCSLYSQQYQPTEATYQPGWNGGSFYNVETSWSYCAK